MVELKCEQIICLIQDAFYYEKYECLPGGFDAEACLLPEHFLQTALFYGFLSQLVIRQFIRNRNTCKLINASGGNVIVGFSNFPAIFWACWLSH